MQKLNQIFVFFRKKYWFQEFRLYIRIYFLKKQNKKIYDDKNPNYLCFCEARRFIRSLKFTDLNAYYEYILNDRHKFIPANPKKFYEHKKWYGPEDFIGIKKDICEN